LKVFPDVLLKTENYTQISQLLDPQNFNDLKCNGVGLPVGALNALSAKLIGHDSRATPEALQGELLNLATHWYKLKVFVREEYLTKMSTEDGDDEQTPDEEWDVVNKTNLAENVPSVVIRLCPTKV